MKEILKEIQNDMDDFFAEMDKAIGIEPEPKCGMDEAMTILNVMQKESERRFDDSKEAS